MAEAYYRVHAGVHRRAGCAPRSALRGGMGVLWLSNQFLIRRTYIFFLFWWADPLVSKTNATLKNSLAVVEQSGGPFKKPKVGGEEPAKPTMTTITIDGQPNASTGPVAFMTMRPPRETIKPVPIAKRKATLTTVHESAAKKPRVDGEEPAEPGPVSGPSEIRLHGKTMQEYIKFANYKSPKIYPGMGWVWYKIVFPEARVVGTTSVHGLVLCINRDTKTMDIGFIGNSKIPKEIEAVCLEIFEKVSPVKWSRHWKRMYEDCFQMTLGEVQNKMKTLPAKLLAFFSGIQEQVDTKDKGTFCYETLCDTIHETEWLPNKEAEEAAKEAEEAAKEPAEPPTVTIVATVESDSDSDSDEELAANDQGNAPSAPPSPSPSSSRYAQSPPTKEVQELRKAYEADEFEKYRQYWKERGMHYDGITSPVPFHTSVSPSYNPRSPSASPVTTPATNPIMVDDSSDDEAEPKPVSKSTPVYVPFGNVGFVLTPKKDSTTDHDLTVRRNPDHIIGTVTITVFMGENFYNRYCLHPVDPDWPHEVKHGHEHWRKNVSRMTDSESDVGDNAFDEDDTDEDIQKVTESLQQAIDSIYHSYRLEQLKAPEMQQFMKHLMWELNNSEGLSKERMKMIGVHLTEEQIEDVARLFGYLEDMKQSWISYRFLHWCHPHPSLTIIFGAEQFQDHLERPFEFIRTELMRAGYDGVQSVIANERFRRAFFELLEMPNPADLLKQVGHITGASHFKMLLTKLSSNCCKTQKSAEVYFDMIKKFSPEVLGDDFNKPPKEGPSLFLPFVRDHHGQKLLKELIGNDELTKYGFKKILNANLYRQLFPAQRSGSKKSKK